MIITIPEDFCNLIESLQYEVDSRKDLLNFMVNSGIDVENDSFKKYHKQYMEYFVKYNTAKSELQQEYIDTRGSFNRWNLNFATGEVTAE